MNLEDIYNQLEKLENDLEYYTNRLEEIKSLVMPQGTSFDKVLMDGRKHTDKILKYVEMEDKLQLEATIKYIKDKINHLNTLKEKEIERLNNIINELEHHLYQEWLEWKDSDCECIYSRAEEDKAIYDKLQELKEVIKSENTQNV